jgi:soluble lytic murein transglycosylase
VAKPITDADLAPIRLGKDDALARELILRKEWKTAAKAVDGTTAGARLVRGWLLEKAKQPKDALTALKGVDAALPVLRDLILLTRGRALMQLEQYAQAAKLLGQVQSTDFIGWSARRERARAFREAELLDAAAKAYSGLVNSGRPADIRSGLLGLARVEEARKRPQVALDLAKRLDVEFPADWTASSARKLAKGLYSGDTRLSKRWHLRTPEQIVQRAEKLLKRHKNAQVVDGLAGLKGVNLTPALACRKAYALGKALRKLRKWKEAWPQLQAAAKTCSEAKSDLAPWALYLAGKAAERLSHEEAAANYNRQLMTRHPDHRLGDDGAYLVLRHLIDDKDDYNSAKALAHAMVARFPKGDMVTEGLFFMTVQALLKKRYSDARTLLELDATLPPRDFKPHHAGRREYWLARLDQLANKRASAKTGYASVMATAPFSWYAILAHSRLKELDAKAAAQAYRTTRTATAMGPTLPAGDTADWRFPTPTGLKADSWKRAVLLARLGLPTLAWPALKDAGVKDDRRDLLWLSAWILDRAGAHHVSHDLLRRQLTEYRRFPPAGPLRKHWDIAFPTPFKRLVQKAAKDTGVDQAFIWGIMREESGFNAAVQSWAAAIGLMQLILPTAKSMRDKKKKEKKITRARLKVPAINIRLGSRYLAHVKKKTGAQWALIPAGYNAGGGALKRWLKARGNLPLDLFVETIPFQEARWYTKRVVSSWGTYRALHGDGQLPYVSQKTKG